MTLGEIRDALFQILTIISDEETKLFVRQDMQSLVATPGTLFNKYQGAFKDLKTDFFSYLSNDINTLRSVHARDVTKEIHKPECTLFIKDRENQEEEATYYSQVVDPFIPPKTDALTADEIELNKLPIDASDIIIRFNYSVNTVLDYLVKEGLLEVTIDNNKSPSDFDSEPESSDETSDDSIGNVHSDEDDPLSDNENTITPDQPKIIKQVSEEISLLYKVNIDRLYKFSIGLASKKSPFHTGFKEGIRTALELHYQQIQEERENNAKKSTPGNVITIEELVVDTPESHKNQASIKFRS